MSAATPVPLSEAMARISELVRCARRQHDPATSTRNGEPEGLLLSVEDLEGLDLTLEILADGDSLRRISESLDALEQGDDGADIDTVRRDLAPDGAPQDDQ